MSKKLIVSLVLLGCLAATGAGYSSWDHLFPAAPGVNPRNFARLAVGMDEPQVAAILGTKSLQFGAFSTGGHVWSDVQWRDDDYVITVTFFTGEAINGTCRRLDGSEPDRSFAEDGEYERIGERLSRWLRL